MEYEFSRTERLIGMKKINTLKHATIMIFGVGGVGSHCIEALARSGVGHLIIIDNDVISLTNINRQSIAYHSTIGQFKTRVMKEKILDINPDADVQTFETFITPDNLQSIFENSASGIDYVIDAIDNVTAKLALAQYTAQHQISMIASMGTGNKLHPELFQITDIYQTSVCPLCRVMRRELKKRNISGLKVLFSNEEPLSPVETEEKNCSTRRAVPGSMSFVPPVAGLLIAGEVIRELCNL